MGEDEVSVSDRDDFVTAYAAVRGCTRRRADALLQSVEIQYAEQENTTLRQQLDDIGGQQIQEESAERRRLTNEINDWKSWESRARGAAFLIARHLDNGHVVSGLVLQGKYDEALAFLERDKEH